MIEIRNMWRQSEHDKRPTLSVEGDIEFFFKWTGRLAYSVMPLSILQDKFYLTPIKLYIGDLAPRSSVLHGWQMYDAALERYIPVLMAMARIYWDRENYPMVEKLFRQAAEFCSDHDTWKLNAAHVFFMEEKFKVRASFPSCAIQFECHRVCLYQLAGAPSTWLRHFIPNTPPCAGGYSLLRANCEEAGRDHPRGPCNCSSEPLREPHNDQPERGGGGTHAKGGQYLELWPQPYKC